VATSSGYEDTSDWTEYTFIYDPGPASIEALSLENDTGDSDSDGVTADAILVGTLAEPNANGWQSITIEFDHDGDGDDTADGVAFTDELGRFVYQPEAISYGDPAIRARASQWDFATGQYIDGEWAEFTTRPTSIALPHRPPGRSRR